jgi:hypothetical protein
MQPFLWCLAAAHRQLLAVWLHPRFSLHLQLVVLLLLLLLLLPHHDAPELWCRLLQWMLVRLSLLIQCALACASAAGAPAQLVLLAGSSSFHC